MQLCVLFYCSMVKPAPSLGPVNLVPMYCSSFEQHQRDLALRQTSPSEHTRRGQFLSGHFGKHLENMARLPSLLWCDWGFFKILQRSSSSLKEGCRGNPNSFNSYFPSLLQALQMYGSELIPEAGVHYYFLFINIDS